MHRPLAFRAQPKLSEPPYSIRIDHKNIEHLSAAFLLASLFNAHAIGKTLDNVRRGNASKAGPVLA
tara:strand:- start:84 stop:281 length:198 start_codon:yes stop_codon:yes gene_type:complete